MEKLEINLFGVFEARADGVPIRLPTRRVELILALLALDVGRAISRSHLAALIWPGQPEAQARASLRQAIFRLRTALGPSQEEALEVTSGWLKLRRDRVSLDLDRLETATCLAEATTGLPLDGLAGFEPEIEDMLHSRRAELRQRFVTWLEVAEKAAVETRQHAELEQLARLHLSLDAYDEGALRMLMTALSRQGRRNASLEAFHDTSRRIRTELSVAVEPATLDLFNSIRSAEHATPAQADVPLPPEQPHADRPDEAASSAVEVPAEMPAHLRHLAAMHLLSERLRIGLRDADPESAEAQSRAAVEAIRVAVEREGGRIVGRAGHHLSCVFGIERPDESPSLSAALAAFEIARQDCAVALHAGQGIVVSETEALPLAYVAQKIAEDTPVGTVRLTAPVEAACRGAFALEKTSPALVEAEEVQTWRLSGEAIARGGFDIRKARGLSRFVGREAEMATLVEALGSEGPRAVVMVGEPGIGKSRLLHEFGEGVASEKLLRVQFTRGETGGTVERFAEPLFALTGTRDARAGQDVLDRLVEAVAAPGVVDRMRPPLAGLLGHSQAGLDWVGAPRASKFQWLADALLIAIASICGRDAVLVVEDAHWADEDAQLLLDRLVHSLDGAGPMLLITQRPGAAKTWAGHGQVSVMTLRPLDGASAATLLRRFGLSHSASGAILKRGGGIPLFLEELARFGTAGDAAAPGHIPIVLSGLLSHRIDALAAGPRRVIEAAAVIGSEPSDDLLAALSELRPEAYEAAITSLADVDLLFRIRSVPHRVYGFKHALLQDAAYQSIPATRRKALHAAVVSRLEPAWREGDKSRSAMLAGHAAKAGLACAAVDFAFAATEEAVSACTYALADRMLDVARKALELLEPDRDVRRLELQLLQLRLPVLVAFAKTEQLHANLSSALTISRELGDDLLLAHLSLHAAFVFQHYDPTKAIEHADAVLGIARRIGNLSLIRESSIARCQILSFQGKTRDALAAMEDYAHAWEDDWAERDEYLVSRYVMNQYLLSRSFGAVGDADNASVHVRQAAHAAIENDHPIDRYIAFLAIGDLFKFAERSDQAILAYQGAAEIARKQAHTFFQTFAEVRLGKVELGTDDADNGVARLRRLVDMGDSGLDPVLRLEAEAALACSAAVQENSAEHSLVELLQAADALDLPLVRVQILGALARIGPTRAQEFIDAAETIVGEQGYATCRLPDDLTSASFMEPASFAG